MKKPTKKPSGKQQQIIVLADHAGNYYELSRATLERSRVDDRRKKKVEEDLQNKPEEFRYIGAVNIPGSIAADPLKGGRALHYAGFYLRSTKSKR
jgi:hypothetical protein